MRIEWVTGGRGYLGRHVARHLADLGRRVFGIGHGDLKSENLARCGYSGWVAGEIENLDLNKLAHLSGAPDTIYHLAGGSSVKDSIISPLDDFYRTVVASAHLLEWIRMNSPRTKLVAVSSAAVYGDGHHGPIKEEAPRKPLSPYGVHKAVMERLIASYGSTYQISSVVVRLFSVYGPGLKKQLIWDLCEKLRSFDGAPVVLGGHGSEKRDWIYVEDAVRLIVQAEAMCNPQTAVINGGNGVGVPISKVADLIIREWESDVAVKFSKECRPGDPQCLIADVGLATQAGFQPRISLEEGIKRTVDWVKVGGQ